MGQPWSQQPHTLAQFARRAGMAESGARARYREGKLPAPDRTDADGKPLWFPATIDAWCARTGKEVAEKALWLFRAPAAVTPAVELQRAVVDLRSGYHRFTAFVIVWDTDHGHVVYLQPVGETGGTHKDWLAAGAAELLRPRFWSSAVVVMPVEEGLEDISKLAPQAYIYRLAAAHDPLDPAESDTGTAGGRDRAGVPSTESPFAGMRRWFRRTPAPAADATPIEPAAPTPRAVWEGQLELEDIARAIGHPLPLWLYDTTTVDNARKAARFDKTFPVADTVTGWPAALARLELAVQTGMMAEYPAAFAALATDTNEGLAALRAAHDSTADRGPGWYLACRPARPAVPVELEQHLLAGTVLHPGVVNDLDQVADELIRLRAVEADLDVDDPRGDTYAHVIDLLAWQLRRAARDAGEISDLDEDYVRVADDELVRYSAPWDGPVVDAWHRTLTPITDLDQVRRLRRVHKLLHDDGLDVDRIREAYRDNAGRYVVVVELTDGGLWSYAEWPVALNAVDTWTDQTVIAADDTLGSTVTLLALTPTENGSLRTDPVPMPPRSYRDAFAYGYGGSTPGTTYRALLRAALGDVPGTFSHLTHPDDSELWKAISTTKNTPLRLPWPTIKAWANADHNRSRGIPTTWPPTNR